MCSKNQRAIEIYVQKYIQTKNMTGENFQKNIKNLTI